MKTKDLKGLAMGIAMNCSTAYKICNHILVSFQDGETPNKNEENSLKRLVLCIINLSMDHKLINDKDIKNLNKVTK